MTNDEIEKRFEAIEKKIDIHDEKIKALEKGQDEIKGSLATMLDWTADIRAALTDNTKVTTSAKNNAFGWGFLSFISSLLLSLVRVFSGLF